MVSGESGANVDSSLPHRPQMVGAAGMNPPRRLIVCPGCLNPMTTEVRNWLEALIGVTGRGRPRARQASTIGHYGRAVAPTLESFAGRYGREVGEDDVTPTLSRCSSRPPRSRTC